MRNDGRKNPGGGGTPPPNFTQREGNKLPPCQLARTGYRRPGAAAISPSSSCKSTCYSRSDGLQYD